MNSRTIEFDQRGLIPLPTTLSDTAGIPLKVLDVKLLELAHCYFQAKFDWSRSPCTGLPHSPDYELGLTGDVDFRMLGDGIGADPEFKRNTSNELGKVFAIWLMTKHYGYRYFCPYGLAQRLTASESEKWTPREKGNLPDYVAGLDKNSPTILEAKGSYESIAFDNADFKQWREQARRAKLIDQAGAEIEVPRFVIATRWGIANRPRINTKLLAEQLPEASTPLKPAPHSGASMIRGHYAVIFDHLLLFEASSQLLSGTPIIRPQTLVNASTYECTSGPLRGRTFVGPAYVSMSDFYAATLGINWGPRSSARDGGMFYGIDATRFLEIARASRSVDRPGSWEFEPVQIPRNLDGLSLFGDGTVLGDLSHFRPSAQLAWE